MKQIKPPRNYEVKLFVQQVLELPNPMIPALAQCNAIELIDRALIDTEWIYLRIMNPIPDLR